MGTPTTVAEPADGRPDSPRQEKFRLVVSDGPTDRTGGDQKAGDQKAGGQKAGSHQKGGGPKVGAGRKKGDDREQGRPTPSPDVKSLADFPPSWVSKSTAETITCGDPVDVTTGRMFHTGTDVRLPGLTLERTHRSDYRWGRAFGSSWASTLDQRVLTDGPHVHFLAADGSVLTYLIPAEGEQATPILGRVAPLLRLIGGGWLLADGPARLLFAPATGDGESLLSDALVDDEHWAIDRSSDGTPRRLRSAAGRVVELDSVAGRITSARMLPGEHEDDEAEAFELAGFTYNAQGELAAVRNSSGDAENFRYNDEGRMARWDDRNGEWYTYEYDDEGRCVLADGNGGYLRYSFTYADGVTLATDSLGGVHRFEMNDRLQVTTVVDPLGAVTRMDWDAAHRRVGHTDALGRVTRLSYDRSGQLAMTFPDGSTTTIRYDDDGHAASWTGADGRPHDITLRDGQRPDALTAFDSLGRLVWRQRADDSVTEFGWTVEGDLAWRRGPDGHVHEWFYDGEGNLMESIDAGGRAVSIEYGPFDLPVAWVDEVGNRTEYAYDTELRLTSITNPAGQSWQYVYDAAGRTVEETDFDGRTQRYAYDAAGQLVTHTDAVGAVTRYAYDARGRVVERQTDTEQIRLEYNADGQVAAVISPDATVRFERDDAGRIVAESINGRTVRTTYHGELGAVESRTTPSGRSSRWSFDAEGRPVSLATGGHRVRFGYDREGREVSRDVDDVRALRQTFDIAGRLAGQHIAGAAERAFTYDEADRIVAIADSVAGDRSFEADATGRVREVVGDGVPAEKYEYDEAGNLAGAGGERWQLRGSMLERVGTAEYTYDGKGRLVTRTEKAGTWHFGWDPWDNLAEATTPQGVRWRYRYDGFGRRINKQRLAGDGTVVESVDFAWAGDLLVEQSHRTGAGAAVTTSWNHHPDDSVPVTQADENKLSTVVTDVVGTPTHLVGADGVLRWWSRTDLWGRGDAALAMATPLRFPGQYFDAETGLHYNRFRYYEPGTGRYVSVDPLGLSGGPNPTAYVPDPLTWADPLGLTSCRKDQSSPSDISSPKNPNFSPDSATGPTMFSPVPGPPASEATFGMPRDYDLVDAEPRSSRRGRSSRLRGRESESPPLYGTPAAEESGRASAWFNDVGFAPRSVLAEPSSRASSTYQMLRNDLPPLSIAPRTGPRNDNSLAFDGRLHFNEPMVGNRPYNNDAGTGLGDRIAGERDGGRRTAAQVHNYLSGARGGLAGIESQAGREFVEVVNFSERARGYDQEVNMIREPLRRIHGMGNRDASEMWGDVGRWFPPARRGYASDAYMPPSEMPSLNEIMPPPRRQAQMGPDPSFRPPPLSTGLAPGLTPLSIQSTPAMTPYSGGPSSRGRDDRDYEIREPARRSRSPERRSRDDRHRSHRRSASRHPRRRHGDYAGPTSVGPVGPTSLTTSPAPQATAAQAGPQDTRPLTQQLTDMAGNPQAQTQLFNDFRQQLQQQVTLDNGQTLQILAGNVHGQTANTDADLQTLVQAGDPNLPHFNAGKGTPNCIYTTQAHEHAMRTGQIVQAPPVQQPGNIQDLKNAFAGGRETWHDSLQSALSAVGSMNPGARGAIGFRQGDVSNPGHIMSFEVGDQGQLTFLDAQHGTFGMLEDVVDSGGSITVMQYPGTGQQGSPADRMDTDGDNDVDMASDPGIRRDNDGDVVMNVPAGSSAFGGGRPSFNGVQPAGVAKSTAQTPTTADPIDVTTGRMILTHTDAVLPGLTLERTYRSDYVWGRSFGRAWASTLDQRIVIDGDQVRYLAADGSILTFAMPAEGDVAVPEIGRSLLLRRMVGGGWFLSDPASGRDLLFEQTFSDEALLSDVVDGGVRWSIERDAQGTPVKLRSSTGAELGFASSAGLVTVLWLPTRTNDLLPSARFAYGDGGQLVEVTNSSGDPEKFTYAGGRIVRWDDRNGEWYTYTYDEFGRCVATDGKGGYLAYTFHYQDGLTVATDSLGGETRYEIDDNLQVVAQTDPLGATTYSVWDDAYRLLSRTDPLGRTTSYEYDAEGHRTTVVRADGSSSTIVYDALGRAVSWTDFDGSTRNREFDADGRVLAETDPHGDVVRFDQPASNGVSTAIQAGGMLTVRNTAQQVVSETVGDVSTGYLYDATGRIISIEGDNGITDLGWTLEGELAWRENPDGSIEEFWYDGEGNLAETIDAAGRRTLMEYGAFDLLTVRIDDEDNRTEYAYDTELRLTTVTNPAGEVHRYTYDAAGRVVAETDFAGHTQRYAYDVAGQLVTHTDVAGVITHFTYDVLGRVIERRTGDEVVRTAYDPAGRVLVATDGISEVRLQRDALGRVVQETVNGRRMAITYGEQFGVVTGLVRPSGTTTGWSYDDAGRPAVLTAGSDQVRFGYAAGHEVSRVTGAGLSLAQSFDGRGRLATQVVDGVTDRRYAYDDEGRLTAVRDEVQGNRPVEASSDDAQYALDVLGRPVARTVGNGTWQLIWDRNNRLVGAVAESGDRWVYHYDALGRRSAKQRVDAAATVTEEITFVWFGDLLVEQHHRVTGGRTTTTAWEYHPQTRHPVAQIIDGVAQMVVTDADGAPMDVVGADGIRVSDLGGIPLRARGRYLDIETGLLSEQSRVYDSATDRYLPEPQQAPTPAR